MTKERYNTLMSGHSNLTSEEFNEGWHFCFEWDELLIHPDDREAEFCTCG